MAKKITMMQSAELIKAAAGEKISIGAAFDVPVYIAIYEVGNETGWRCIERFKEKVRALEYEVEVHSDTRLFDIVANPDAVAGIDDPEHTVEVAYEVVVTSDPTPEPTPEPAPTPTPTPEPDEKDLGKYLFSFEVTGDLHIDEDNDDHTPGDTNDDWWDEGDAKASFDIAAKDQNILFIESVGDIMECGSPKKGTPEDDYKVFFGLFNVNYWQMYGLRFFTPNGNHDFYGMFESRYGDKIMPERFTNYNSISGSNDSVKNRIAQISIGGQGINGIVPGRGRIVFDTDDGKEHTSGQSDMQFMSYMAYVELYKDAAGFPGSIAPSENRFSDDAVKTMTNYVLSNWDKCKHSLTSWNNGYIGMRNAYSKLNFWMKKKNHLFVNLSIDYGSDIWPINDEWHDHMIHARQLIDLNANDPYIKRLLEYVADTGYSKADEPYNYQYYSPNSLIWLLEIVENNDDKIIHANIHHFQPNRVGNGDPIDDNIPKNGGWYYSEINKAGIMTAQGINKGSNAISGITFWFFNKLFNTHPNIIGYSGHSHISYENKYHFDNHDYPIVMPSVGNAFVYTMDSFTPKEGEGAWLVSVPSLSKPRRIEKGSSSRMYEDAETTIVEAYENGVKIKGYKIRKNNVDVYDSDNPLVEQIIVIKK